MASLATGSESPAKASAAKATPKGKKGAAAAAAVAAVATPVPEAPAAAATPVAATRGTPATPAAGLSDKAFRGLLVVVADVATRAGTDEPLPRPLVLALRKEVDLLKAKTQTHALPTATLVAVLTALDATVRHADTEEDMATALHAAFASLLVLSSPGLPKQVWCRKGGGDRWRWWWSWYR